jgi:hypothetical protein
MSFRRPKGQALRSERWARFSRQRIAQFHAAGLPTRAHEAEATFQYFLMHGCHEGFSVDELDATQKKALRELVVAYLAAGFGDPGLGLFDTASHDEIRHAAAMRASSSRLPGRSDPRNRRRGRFRA